MKQQTNISNKFIFWGSILAAIAVALNAFAAHSFKKIFSAESMEIFETGAKYQIYHSLALLLTGVIANQFSHKFIPFAGKLFIIGIALFSGSLYLLTMVVQFNLPYRFIGIITPFGGLSFIVAWLLLAISFYNRKIN